MEQILVDRPSSTASVTPDAVLQETHVQSPEEWKTLLDYWDTTKAYTFSPKTIEKIWDYLVNEFPDSTLEERKAKLQQIENRLGTRFAEQPWIKIGQWVTLQRNKRAIEQQIEGFEHA